MSQETANQAITAEEFIRRVFAGEQQPERRWIYNQRTGQLRDPDGWLDQQRGYSGENSNQEASTGCIILNRRQREAIIASGLQRLDVVNEPEWRR